MKASRFLSVVEKFWVRAQLFFLSEEFTNKVKQLSGNVRNALAEQLNIVFRTDDDLPPDAEMGEKAIIAFNELCDYLNKHDPGVGYN